MFFSLYKKQISIILGICLIFIFLSFILYNTININKSDIDLDVKVGTGNINFDDRNISGINEYDYYQVYIYPSIYDITCETEVDGLCDQLLSQKSNMDGYILSYFGKDLKKGSTGEVNLTTFLNDEESSKILLRDIFMMLYIPNENLIESSGYEKYFDFKKDSLSDGQDITLNDMEIMCVEQIISSIPAGSYDTENQIIQKVESECSMFGDMSSIDIAFGGISGIEGESIDIQVDFSINISEIKLQYKFFIKEGLEFEEVKSSIKRVPKNIKISDTIDLDEFIR